MNQNIIQESPAWLFNSKSRGSAKSELFIMKKNEPDKKLDDAAKQNKTNPVLLSARKIASDYASATGALICVRDANGMPIPEMFEEVTTDKNICLFCAKYRARKEVKKLKDLSYNPCGEIHVNAIKEARQFGGFYIHMCEFGFMFWTSPIYENGRFIGAFLATGFLGVEKEETAAEMFQLARGKVSKEKIEQLLGPFSQVESEKINALAKILLVCAESLSAGPLDYHEMFKRRQEQQASISAEIEILKEKYPPGAGGPPYPLEKERMLISALRRGNREAAKNILNELLASLLFANPDEFKNIQFRAIELVVLISRADCSPACTGRTILENNNKYLKQIEDTAAIEDLADILHGIVEKITAQIFSFQGIPHAAALRKAEQFIRENFTRKISLQEIAAVSGLSAPYFSTVFKDEMGENLSAYLNRLRVEKAAALLGETDLSLSEIAGLSGFEDQSWFSKIFKAYSGMSPGKYRNQGKTLDISVRHFAGRNDD